MYDKTPLHDAAELDDVTAAQRLLDEGADLEAETVWGATPLQWAGTMNARTVGALLRERGARLNRRTAAALGWIDDVRQLPVFPAQPISVDLGGGNWGCRPVTELQEALDDSFYIACRNGHTEVARLLLGEGASVNARGFFGGTALHWAAANGYAATVEFLLESGARTDVVDEKFGSTAAGWAEEFEHHDIAERIRRG